MRSLVVLFALVAVAVAAPAPEGPAKNKKRSLGHVVAYSGAPVEYVVSEPVVGVAPAVYGASAVTHQSHVNVQSSPAYVTYSSPLVAQQVVSSPAVVDARSVYSPVAAVYAPSAVSHQSRVDYRSSPAVVSHQQVYPAVYGAHSVYSPSVYSSYW